MRILNVKMIMNNYLIGDDSTHNQWRNNGCNGRDAISDGHHRASKVRAEIDMVDLVAANRSGIQTHSYGKNDDGPDVIVGRYEAHKRQGNSRTPKSHCIAGFSDCTLGRTLLQSVVGQPTHGKAEEPHDQVWQRGVYTALWEIRYALIN